MLETILVRVDDENNATEWWDALQACRPVLASQLRRNGAAEITRSDWNAITALPGWRDGPDYAPTPIVCVGPEPDDTV